MSNPYREHLQSGKWHSQRTEALERDGHKCQNPRCGSTTPLDVHHKSYRNGANAPLEDLCSLCRECHEWVNKLKEASGEKRWEEVTGQFLSGYPSEVFIVRVVAKNTSGWGDRNNLWFWSSAKLHGSLNLDLPQQPEIWDQLPVVTKDEWREKSYRNCSAEYAGHAFVIRILGTEKSGFRYVDIKGNTGLMIPDARLSRLPAQIYELPSYPPRMAKVIGQVEHRFSCNYIPGDGKLQCQTARFG
jgi:hypothetical protein